MVWNNNQQMHGAPGKISHLCVRRKTSLRFTTTVRCSSLQATQRKYRKPKQAFEVYMIKSQQAIALGKCVRMNRCIIQLHSACMLEWLL